MPPYLTNFQIWLALWPIFAFAFASSAILTIAVRGWVIARQSLKRGFVTVFALSLLGIVTGQVTGLSRVAAVGAVLPAVLSLIGGVLVYMIGTKSSRTHAFVAVGIIGLTANLIVGVYWGSHSRVVFERTISAPGRVLSDELAKEKNRNLINMQRLLNYAELIKIHKEIEQQNDIKIPLEIYDLEEKTE